MMKPSFFLLLISCLFQAEMFGQVDHWETICFDSSQWRYTIPNINTSADWPSPSFDDAGWTLAPGGFGMGDNDDNTTLPSGTGAIFQRIQFNIADLSLISKLILEADYDDGFVAYLNGIEIARAGFSVGVTPVYNSFSESQHEANLYQGLNPSSFIIAGSLLQSAIVSGNNVLAIQTHNVSSSSSDISARYFLLAGMNNSSNSFNASLPTWFTPPFEFYESTLPIVVINTYGVTIPDEPKIDAEMGIIFNGDGQINTITDPFNEFSGLIAIESRGSSSQSFPAKSYGLETRGPDSVNYNVSIFNWPIDNDWILYAPYTDKSLIRNVLTYQWGNDMGRWAPRTKLCELVVNEEYMGIYVMMERIKTNPGRVNINPLLPQDTLDNELTGGYIIKVDKTTGGGVIAWTSPYLAGAPSTINIQYQMHDPDLSVLHPAQLNYIQNHITDWETALSGNSFTDPIDGYSPYMDVNSFIDFFLINEITKNVDGYRISSFLYKERFSEGGKIVAGPLWDFNIALGNANYCYGQNTDGWASDFNEYCAGGLDVPFWWNRLLEDPVYAQKARCRWEQLRSSSFHTDSLMAQIDTLASQLAVPAERHYVRWPILGTYVWPNNFIGNTYAEEIDYLKTWLTQRLDWMDNNMFGDSCSIDMGIENQQWKNSIQLFPNPASHACNVQFSENQLFEKLILYNTYGQVVDQYNITDRRSFEIPMQHLASGVYHVVIKNETEIFTSQIIKE
jgi:hypothetical protein